MKNLPLLRYWYLWLLFAALAAIVLIWLWAVTGAGVFVTLAIAEAILALYLVWVSR